VEVAKRLLGEERVSSTWLTADTTYVWLIRRLRWRSLKFETPTARARPFANICSAALYAATVSSKSLGTG
jgi:hypothetical protein